MKIYRLCFETVVSGGEEENVYFGEHFLKINILIKKKASNLYLESYNKILYILHQFFPPKYLLRMYFWKGTPIPLSCILRLISSASAFGWERSKEVFLNLANICHLWSMLYSVEAVYNLKSLTSSVKELVCVFLWYIFRNKMFSISCLMGNVSGHAHSKCVLYCIG